MREIIKTICYMDTKIVLVRVQKALSAWIEMKVQKSVADGSIIF